MTIVSSAKHEDRHVSRECDICHFVVRFDCYPRTYNNQMTARRESARELEKHIETHSIEEILEYIKRIHQV